MASRNLGSCMSKFKLCSSDLARGDGGRQGRGLGPFLFHPCTHPAQLSGTCSDGDTPCNDYCYSCFCFHSFLVVVVVSVVV